jgi:hypothetical protein
MKTNGVILLVFTALCMAGCKQKAQERVSYHDRNDDGKVDLEIHKHPDAKDPDWALMDNDFDGRYEAKTVFGVVLKRSTLDLPVPTGVQIERAP